MSPADSNDPFAAFGSDRTVIKPGAGRMPPAAVPPTAAPPLPPQGAAGATGATMSIDELMGASLNPLVSAAMPLLAAAPRVRHTARHPSPGALKEALADGIRKFEAQARAQGVPNEQVIAGRYILCTFLDESAASTPWGGSGAWSANSLLVLFHNETWGGEKVFQLMSKLAENVQGNRALLELLYVVLALGFEGRFRVVDNGQSQLDAVRQRLAHLLKQGQTTEKALSPHWEGAGDKGQRLSAGVPVWVLATGAVMLLALVWAGFKFALSYLSDPLFAQLQGLEVKTVKVAAAQPLPAPTPPPAAKPRLAVLLKPEIAAGLVEVQDLADRSVVTIKGDGFFEPGSTEVASSVRTLLPRIAEALGQLPGQVLITGHTDNQPIRTLRFPSNWHLSQQRADAVRHELSRTVQPQRLRAEGRADSEPVTENDSAAGRARNRRVEITLFNPQGAAA
jgi:type VI secretion system protein ImpK